MTTTPIDADLLATEAEGLSNEIEALENTRAPLYAVYGYNGTWPDERKAILSMCAVIIRGQFEGTKVTEAQIDQLAHDAPHYRQTLYEAEKDRTRLALLDAEIAGKQRRYELARERMANIRKIAGL